MDTIVSDFSFGLFIWQLILVSTLIPFVWACVLLIKNKQEMSISKAIWVAVFCFVPIVSSLFYIVNFYMNQRKLKAVSQ